MDVLLDPASAFRILLLSPSRPMSQRRAACDFVPSFFIQNLIGCLLTLSRKSPACDAIQFGMRAMADRYALRPEVQIRSRSRKRQPGPNGHSMLLSMSEFFTLGQQSSQENAWHP